MRLISIIVIILFADIANAQWHQSNLTSGNVYCINSKGSTFFAGKNNRIYKSTDNGINWSISSYGLTSNYVRSIQFIDTTIYAGTDVGVFVSTNYGVSWSLMNNGLSNVNVNDLAIIDTTIFAGTYDGLFRSENNANSWTQLATGLPTGGSPPNSILSLGTTGNFILAGIYGASVRASTNKGDSWYSSGSGISIYDNIYGGFGFNGNIIYACSYNGVYKSNNGGGSWTHSVNGLTSFNINAVAIADTNVFVSTNDGVYLSSINNNFWTKINDGFPVTIAIKSLYIKGDTLFAGSNNNLGIWYRLLGDILTGIEIENSTFSNLFPNPSSGKFKLENKNNIRLVEVYNTLGEIILSIKDNTQNKYYDIDISNQPCGIYFLKAYCTHNTYIEKLIKN